MGAVTKIEGDDELLPIVRFGNAEELLEDGIGLNLRQEAVQVIDLERPIGISIRRKGHDSGVEGVIRRARRLGIRYGTIHRE